ncbi:restriction endonuclease [Streptomyces filamentosus]|uniref:restriction endonuclease n=1 Tax=Streptomyces filamentosus TaxID=67294 RepID=UPI0033F6358A
MASTSRRPRPDRAPTRRSPAAQCCAEYLHGLRQLAPGQRRLLAFAGILALLAGGGYLQRHPEVLAVLLTLLGLAGAATAYLWGHRFYQRVSQAGLGALPADPDHWRALTPGGFQLALVRLCRRDGCTGVTVLDMEGSRVTITARAPDGRSLLMQCQQRTEADKVSLTTLCDMHETYQGIRPCAIAVAVTTSTFTASAVDWNADLGQPLRLVGSRQLTEWATRTGPAPWQ